ncbi:SusC/RagA family TonB-linked outer membrane protein [Ornithobacterium rhinotracheale]|nr:SusC/RagA family TonB-linked outer membrane protein [Ornithobacterium rhinotracheale]MRJ09795.1 SusC/RagA family TonB-linked outer membrane protein [Ornithobacterium rhinotracheale]
MPDQVVKGKVNLVAEAANGATQTKSLKYKAGSVLKNDFKLGSIALDEVVAIGYGTAKRKDLTGSVVSFKPTKDDAKIATSVDDLLQGKVAGVNIVSGGSNPGAAGSVTIRGANSLTGDSQPLYVIDNVPQYSTGETMSGARGTDFQSVQDPLAGINPNDIEDIQVLKDASATAIYGSRGANGVILITTKRGKMGKMNISLGSTFTVAQAYRLFNMMDLKEYAAYDLEKHPDVIHFKINGDEVRYLYEVEDEETGKMILKDPVVTNHNWQEEALRFGLSNEYNLNINGGSEKLRYNLSSSFKNVNGIVKSTGLKHGDMRLNLSSDLTDKLSLNLILSGFYRKNNMMSGGNSTGRATGAIIPAALHAAPFVKPDDNSVIDPENKATVFSWINDYEDLSKEYRFSGSADFTYRFTPNIRYSLRTGGNMNNLEKQNYWGTQLYKGENAPNGYYSQSRLERSNYNVENLLFFHKNYGSVEVDATAGVTYDAYKFLNNSLYAKNFPMSALKINGLHTAAEVVIENPIQKDYQLLSYLARLNLSFLKGKYVLTGTIRADGTSKFSKDNRWGYFPSFAAAWNVKQENFLKESDWLDQLKFRFGYGETGSQNIDPYSSIFIYSAGIGYATTDGSSLKGFYIQDVNNPNLKWETTSSVNGGLDFDIFNGRLNASLDIYKKRTKDLLLNITLPGSTSFNVLPINKGELENSGIELALNSQILKAKDLSWSIGGNIAKNNSKILNIGMAKGNVGALENVSYFLGSPVNDHFGAANIFLEGEAPGLFFGFKTDGIIQEGDDYKAAAPFGKGETSPGNLKVVDVNGDGVVNLQDRTIIGDPNPDFTYGFQTNVKYKQVRFKMAFNGVQGGDVMNSQVRYREMPFFNNGNGNLVSGAASSAWRPNNTQTLQPKINSQVVTGYIYDRYLEDGSYLTCSDITLGYTFPSKISEQIGINNLDFFMSVKNAFTITNYSGYDPTSRSFAFNPLIRGVDLWSFPMQRAYIVGVNIMF